MKKLLLMLVTVLGIASMGMAQQKKGIQNVTIQTPTVQCQMCKDRIEKYLLREEGVQKVNVDFRNKRTKVTFLAERQNIENIRTAIANIGYDADDVTAEPEAYKKLPKCCQKPEDGGGKKQ